MAAVMKLCEAESDLYLHSINSCG